MKNNQAPGGGLFVRSAILGTLVTLLACVSLHADPVVHKFQLWGTINPLEKLIFYQGWTNGFLVARGPSGVELATCLDKISGDQAIAMIDKRYKDHPERWSRPITQQMLEALTPRAGLVKGKIRYRWIRNDTAPAFDRHRTRSPVRTTRCPATRDAKEAHASMAALGSVAKPQSRASEVSRASGHDS
jgi:hypothetical protein